MRLSQLGAKLLGVESEVDISTLVAPHTEQHQYDALVSLASSIGIEPFSRSSLLRKHNAGCFQCAQGQFMTWVRKPEDKQKRKRERGIYYYGYQ